jgi:hypothetical protein
LLQLAIRRDAAARECGVFFLARDLFSMTRMDGDVSPIGRESLRDVLVSEYGLERAQRLRHDLATVLAPASAGVWVVAMWPDALPEAVEATVLAGWWMIFAAALCAGALEGHWRRRARIARGGLDAGAPIAGKDDRR